MKGGNWLIAEEVFRTTVKRKLIMKKRICFAVALLAVMCFCGLTFSARPEEGVGLGVFERHLVGTWDVTNKSDTSPFTESVGEVIFSQGEDGTEVEVTSGVFGAAGMVLFGEGNSFYFCIGKWPISFYGKDIAMIEWDSVASDGNYAESRKSPLHIVRIDFDTIFIIGMGYRGYAISTLTRQ